MSKREVWTGAVRILTLGVSISVGNACGSNTDDVAAAAPSASPTAAVDPLFPVQGDGGSSGNATPTPDLIFPDSGAQDMTCAQNEVEAKPKPLDLFFMLDTSGSMGGGADPFTGGQPKIEALRQGIVAFLQDPKSVGLAVAAQKFPLFVGQSTKYECNEDRFATPDAQANWATLPQAAIAKWVSSLEANGLTPTQVALNGAIKACQNRLAAEPSHKCVVVFVTDGRPEGTQCKQKEGSLAEPGVADAASKAAAQSIPVFAIGFPGLEKIGTRILEIMASNGGTGTPAIIEGGDVGTQFRDQLTKIRGVSLGCEFQMPRAKDRNQSVDSSRIHVQFESTDGANRKDLARVHDAAACKGKDGWYLDNNDKPTEIRLCPTSCKAVQDANATSGGKVKVSAECTTIVA